VLHRNVFCALALLCFSGYTSALEVGFEGLVAASASDNVNGANAGGEIDGTIGIGEFGVFGEQRGTRVRGAFSGEIFTQRILDDDDDEFSGVTQFTGAVEFDITPRSFKWYVGDILGVVRDDNAIQPLDDFDNDRRNVFVTGPSFEFDLDSFSRVNARLLYVDQTQDDTELESLINASASWEFDTDAGNTWGLLFGDVFTQNPEDDIQGDFNLLTLAGYWRRDRGRNSYEVRLGATRIDTDDEAINGGNARLTLARQLGPQTTFSVSLTRDLRDENLSNIETLIADGTGRAPEADGFFDETRLELSYDFTSSDSTYDLTVGAAQSNFRLLADATGALIDSDLEDRNNFFASASYTRSFTPRTRIATSLSFESQDSINLPDNSQSLLGSIQLFHRLSRSFEFQLGYRGTVSESEDTINLDALDAPLEIADITENRVTVGFRWSPPTRASRDLTIELRSLLQ